MIELQPWRRGFEVELDVPGDKSLTHRAILFAALGRGDMVIDGWLDAADTRSSLTAAQAFGVILVDSSEGRLVLRGRGQLTEPTRPVDCGNSGTTMRLAAGMAAGVAGLTILYGDESLSRRPMARILDPLRSLGLAVMSRAGQLAPLAVVGGPHSGGCFDLAIASAQVKSALLLAGLTAQDEVAVKEPAPSRDHTERLLAAMGAAVTTSVQGVAVSPGPIDNIAVRVPGDPSSAAFWCAAAALAAGRTVSVKNMLFNPARTGFFRLLETMGCQVVWHQSGTRPEPFGGVTVRGGGLTPFALTAADIPAMVDEVPLAALLATQADGVSVIQGAAELRVKECDRIRVTAEILTALGAAIEETPDGWIIQGPTPLSGAALDAHEDHRMAMLATVASTIASGSCRLSGAETVAVSYPGFFQQYRDLMRTAG